MIEWFIVAFIPIELAIGLLIVSKLLNNAWFPIQKSFSGQPLAEPNFRRFYQSLSFGMVNAGFCYHIAMDDYHLHLTPVRVLRWIGQQPASIPWSAIRLHDKQPMSKRYSRVWIGKSNVVGPAWCFEMLKLES